MNRIPLILALALGTAFGALIAADAPKPVEPKNSDPVAQAAAARQQGWWSSDGSRLVFFAVLEGLYEDGVSQDIVDLIVPPGPPGETAGLGGATPRRSSDKHFIYTCPLCHPASEAFLLYAGREPFRGQKVTKVDTFNSTGGLPAAIEKKLRSDKQLERIEGLRLAIDRWVGKRLDAMRLQPDERKVWQQKIAALRDQGNQALSLFQRRRDGDYYKELYAGWKFCPSCDGSTDACDINRPH